MKSPPSQEGFTLLELLVALSIFAILSAMAYGGLRVVLDSKQRNEQHAQRLIELQTALSFLQRDIEQAVGRSVRDGFGDVQPAWRSGFGARLFSLTRAGWRNGPGLRRSNLQRVSYRFQDGRLARQFWPVLDRADDTEPPERELLTGIEQVELRYLDAQGQWRDQWPPLNLDRADPALLPRAVEISLTLEDMGKVRRVMRVAPGEAAVVQTFAEAS